MNKLNKQIDSLTVADSSTPIHSADRTYSAERTLQLISQNIRIISRNFDSFHSLLIRSKVDWDVIILTECWLMSSHLVPLLDSYSSDITTRNLSQNEGVTNYYKEKLNVVPKEPVLCDANCLSLVIKSSTVVITIYRPPAIRDTFYY